MGAKTRKCKIDIFCILLQCHLKSSWEVLFRKQRNRQTGKQKQTYKKAILVFLLFAAYNAREFSPLDVRRTCKRPAVGLCQVKHFAVVVSWSARNGLGLGIETDKLRGRRVLPVTSYKVTTGNQNKNRLSEISSVTVKMANNKWRPVCLFNNIFF